MRLLSTPLSREIAVLLALKAVALLALWVLFFGPQHRPDVTPAAIKSHLVGDAAPGARPPLRSAYD